MCIRYSLFDCQVHFPNLPHLVYCDWGAGNDRVCGEIEADFGDIEGDGRPDLVMTGLKNETYELS